MTLVHLVWLRGRGAANLAGRRWGSAAAGGALAGIAAGLSQALFFLLMTRGVMPAHLILVDAALGAIIGGVGAAGVGAGLAAAEALSRLHRTTALLLAGTLAGVQCRHETDCLKADILAPRHRRFKAEIEPNAGDG